MPQTRKVLNAFTVREVSKITGTSIHMIDYLAREGYLGPHYDQGRVRGRVRYYSYRDLLVVRVVQKLRESGLELKRLKKAIKLLSEDEAWSWKGNRSFDMLATDGRNLYRHHQNGSLVELTPGLQQTFAFVINVTKTQQEVLDKIGIEKRERYDLRNRALVFAVPSPKRPAQRETKSRRR
jgi:DNA-binding transcriptional MerR regulator